MNAITRLAQATALVLAVATLVVPATQAAEPVGDDWFRDAREVATTIVPANFHGDDWFRDVTGVAADQQPLTTDGVFERAAVRAMRYVPSSPGGEQTVEPGIFHGDGWFGDASPMSTTYAASGFDWADFGVGAGSMLGALVLLTLLTGAVLARRERRMLGRT